MIARRHEGFREIQGFRAVRRHGAESEPPVELPRFDEDLDTILEVVLDLYGGSRFLLLSEARLSGPEGGRSDRESGYQGPHGVYPFLDLKYYLSISYTIRSVTVPEWGIGRLLDRAVPAVEPECSRVYVPMLGSNSVPMEGL